MSLIGAVLLAAQSVSARGADDPQSPQEGGETLVTAQKQTETLVDVPLAVTVLDRKALEEGGLRTIRDAAIRVPNLFLSEFSARRLSFPFVRGVGSGLGDPTVVTYVDDVPQFGFGGTNLPLFAVERVEFLRGVQATLYGRNAVGGLIHVHSLRPGEEREIGAAATFGSDNLEEVSGTYSGPLGGGALGAFGLLDAQRDGFTKNDFTGNRVDDRDGLFGRGRVLWNPSADSELELTFFGERSRDGGFALSELSGLRANPHHINQDFEGLADRDVLDPSLVYRAFGSSADFTAVTSYERWDVLEISDFDFTPIDGVRRRSVENQDYVYQEFRLGSPDARRHGARWLVGASGYVSDRDQEATNIFRPDGAGIFFDPINVGKDFRQGQFDESGAALFGQGTLPVSADFELSAGLRYDYESTSIDRLQTFDPGSGPFVLVQNSDDKHDDKLVPMASAAWHPGADETVYLRAAEGFKAGGFNVSAPAGKEEFGSETAWNYELGWRRSFEHERYMLGATAFYVDWNDIQMSLFDPTVGGYVDNAAAAKTQGLELEGRAGLVEGLDVFASLGLLDTEIQRFVDQFNNDDEGNDLPQAPDKTIGLGLQYAADFAAGGRWFVGADYQGVGEFFYDAGNIQGDSYDLVNLRAGIQGRRLGLTVWVRNAFDQDYVPIAFQPSPVDPNTFVGESGAPRVLGFTLSVHL